MLQLSARAAYGAELRRQIEEKDREKKAKKGIGQQQQGHNSQILEQGVFSRNRYEFERARVAGGMGGFGIDNFQRPAAGGSVLPPLNMDPIHSNVENIWNRPTQPQTLQRQQQQDVRARNEITAPGTKRPSSNRNNPMRMRLRKRCCLLYFLCVVTLVQASMISRRKMNASASSKNTGKCCTWHCASSNLASV
jgi:hypothetical protein